MNKIIYLSILITVFSCSEGNIKKTQNGDSKYQEVLKLKDGFKVTHSPEEGKAMLNGRSGSKYTWLYKTTVEAKQDITILEFGAFGLYNGQWIFGTYTGKPFTTKDFEEWYNCPNGKLLANKKYLDSKNWTGGELLEKSETLWYYIGKTESGEIVKAIAKLTSLAETQD